MTRGNMGWNDRPLMRTKLSWAILVILAVFVVFPLYPSVAETDERQAILIQGVQIVDFAEDRPRVRDSASVLVRDGRIAAIGGEADMVADTVGARRVSGSGLSLLPGLTDMHVHIWDEAELGAYLAAGVTTVRNLSGMPMHLELAERIASGELAGPRLITTGPILNGPGPNAQPNHQIVRDGEEARAAVRAHHAAGYRRIKVYSNLSRAAYEAIRSEAARLDMRILGHTPEGVREPGIPHERPFAIAFDELLDDDFETIEHVESIVWHGLRDRHDDAAARALAQRIAAAGVAVDPTLVAFANLYRVAESEGGYLERAGTDMLNPFISALEAENYARWSAEDATRAAAQLDFYRRMTAVLAEAGVMLVAGSDAGIFTNIPGVSLHDELDLFVESGLTPAAALRAATSNAALAMGLASEFGRIEIGQRADLLLVDGDPLTDIAALRRPVAVIADGRLFDAADLDAMRAAARAGNAERTQRNVFEALEVQGTPLPGS